MACEILVYLNDNSAAGGNGRLGRAAGEARDAEDELYPGESREDGSGLCVCHKT